MQTSHTQGTWFLAGAVCLSIPFASAEELLPLSADVSASYGTIGSRVFLPKTMAPTRLDDLALGIAIKKSRPVPTVPVMAKPTYVAMNAELANWDADSEPDGWRCRLLILDQFDQSMVPGAIFATFELHLRVPRRDRNGFRDIQTEAIRWSKRLECDELGIHDVKLPLRTPLPIFIADSAHPSRHAGSRKASFSRQERVADRFRELNLAAGNGSAFSVTEAAPAYGVLTVRVSVPTVGILEATDPVLVDEPMLVDSTGPQR